MRSGLRMVLEREDDFAVVSEAGDAEAALRTVLGHKPAVLVLDLNMPGELTRSTQSRACARSRPTRAW